MLKYVILAVLLTAVAAQLNLRDADVVPVVREWDNQEDGTFSWASELSDGQRIEQSGYSKAGPEPETPIQVIQGSYTYTSPEGKVITVRYIADENGFQPIGDHLPGPASGQRQTQSAVQPQRQAAAQPQRQTPAQPPRRPSPPQRG